MFAATTDRAEKPLNILNITIMDSGGLLPFFRAGMISAQWVFRAIGFNHVGGM
jgi:hypothetical protein